MSGTTVLHLTEMEEVTTGRTATEHNVYLTDPSIVYNECFTEGPYFYSTGVTDYPSLMSIGILTATTSVTIGAYVIDWHLGSPWGAIVLISGDDFASDPSIQVEHPFTNIPVPGGTLYPVIRWVYFNGVQYSSVLTAGMSYSPDLYECLDPVTVKQLTCYNGVNPAPGASADNNYNFYTSNYVGVNPTYTSQFHYSYTTSVVSDATKTISFILNTGGTTKYLAWYFKGYTIADTVKISYVNIVTMAETVLTNWFIGSNITTDYTSNPKKFASQYMQSVICLIGFTYNTGDYLKIEITPNAVNPSTDWDFYTVCMSGFTCTNFPYGYNIINNSTITMTGVTGADQLCSYTASVSTFSGYTGSAALDFFKYYAGFACGLNGGPYNNPITMNFYIGTGYTQGTVGNDATCYVQTNSVSINHTGTGTTLVFQDSGDYNIYRNSYLTTTGATNMNNYVTGNTFVNYYKMIVLYVRSGTTCGDNPLTQTVYFHYSSPVTFNDVSKTISIKSLTGITNGLLSGVTCNNLHYVGDILLSSIDNSNGSLSNFNWPSTSLRHGAPFFGQYISSTPTYYNQTEATAEYYQTIHPTIINGVCSMSDWVVLSGATFNGGTIDGYYTKFKCRLKAVITNTSDPVNNWQLFNGLDTNGYPTATWPVTPIFSIP